MKPISFHSESYSDERGEIRPFWKHKYSGMDYDFVEDRFSTSHQGVIRGFHGDANTTKLCGCIHGSLFLVLWDVKEKKKYEYTITEANKLQVLIPPYYLNAHQCLSEKCVLFYKWDQHYQQPENQWSVNYQDPTINVDWPISNPILSDRDINSKFLNQA
jgi:dTDP-4-dehydrorhamnose 3,5-epimerase